MPNRAIIDHEMFAKLRERYRYSWILLRELVRTDFKLRYQGSALGYVWSLLRPLFLFVILYFVFAVFLKVGADMPHWPVGLLVGIVLWNFFSEITSAGVGAIVGRGDVIRKINFPKYIIVLASSISALINLGLNMVIIMIFLFINGVELSWSALISPLYILEIFVFGLGLAFILSTLYVKFRDINFIWEIILQGLFYASIVLYPVSMILASSQKAAGILLLNPVSQSIQDVRHTLISNQYDTLTSVIGGWANSIPFIIVLITLLIGAWYFRKQSPKFAEDI